MATNAILKKTAGIREIDDMLAGLSIEDAVAYAKIAKNNATVNGVRTDAASIGQNMPQNSAQVLREYSALAKKYNPDGNNATVDTTGMTSGGKLAKKNAERNGTVGVYSAGSLDDAVKGAGSETPTAPTSPDTPNGTETPTGTETTDAYRRWLIANGYPEDGGLVDAQKQVNEAALESRKQIETETAKSNPLYGVSGEQLGRAGLTDSGYADMLGRNVSEAEKNALTATEKSRYAALANAETEAAQTDAQLRQAYVDAVDKEREAKTKEINTLDKLYAKYFVGADGEKLPVSDGMSRMIADGYDTEYINKVYGRSGSGEKVPENAYEAAKIVIGDTESIADLPTSADIDAMSDVTDEKKAELKSETSKKRAEMFEKALTDYNDENTIRQFIKDAGYILKDDKEESEYANIVLDVLYSEYKRGDISKDDYIAVMSKNDVQEIAESNHELQTIGEIAAHYISGDYGDEEVKGDLLNGLAESISPINVVLKFDGSSDALIINGERIKVNLESKKDAGENDAYGIFEKFDDSGRVYYEIVSDVVVPKPFGTGTKTLKQKWTIKRSEMSGITTEGLYGILKLAVLQKKNGK